MNKIIVGALGVAFAAATIGIAVPAQALPEIPDPDPRTPFDFSGEVIELPFGFQIKFADSDWEPGFQGRQGHDLSVKGARTDARNPSG